LLLPRSHAEYLRGRRRQALRTNLRKAAGAGIECEVVEDRRRAVDDARHALRRQLGRVTEADLHTWTSYFRPLVTRPETTVAVARDSEGQLVAIVTAVIDDSVCLITQAVATRHDARWALHDYLVRMLIARRVRYLLSNGGGAFGALGFTKNIQDYQHLLGYELRHVIPLRAHHTARKRRRLASLAVVAATTALVMAPTAASATIEPSILTASQMKLEQTIWTALAHPRVNPHRPGSALRARPGR
jgi:hypothetical protein